MTAPARIRQADIDRTMRSAKKAGFSRVRLTLEPTGNVVFDFSDEEPLATVRSNPLDRLLDR